jgi:flavin-dependent dehydrogenase
VSPSMTRRVFDVGVIGGGPSGSATAILLARAGVSVLLLEASDYSSFRVGETLPPFINRQLDRMGVSHSFSCQKHTPAPGVISVWGSENPQVKDFLFGVHGSGWQIDRVGFDRMLFENAKKSGADVQSSSHMISTPKRVSEAWMFEFACKGKRVDCSCRFLVNATGRSGTSWLSGFSAKVVQDRLIGVVWAGQQSAEWPYMLVESVDNGWFYCANLPNERASVVYMTDSDLYRDGQRVSSDLWLGQLHKTAHAHKRLPRRADLSCLKLFSAATSVRRDPVGRGWCAVGDAAISFDPLSGLGVYFALESAAQAASAIREHLDDNEPLHLYRHWVIRAFQNYSVARHHYYSAEQRWPDSVFWQRRRFITGRRLPTLAYSSFLV